VLSLMESGGVAFLFSLFVTPLWIDSSPVVHSVRRSRRLASTHLVKAGTPTMGGVLIVVSAVLGYVMGHVGTSVVFTRSGILVVAVIIASGFLGFLDDYISIRNARNLGLNKRGKFVGQLLIAAVFAVLSIDWFTRQPTCHSPVLATRLEPDVNRMDRPGDSGDHLEFERGESD